MIRRFLKQYHLKDHKVLSLLMLFFLIVDLLLFVFWFSVHKQGNVNHNITGYRQKNLYPELADIKGSQLSFSDLSKFFTALAEKKGAEYAYEILKIAPIPPNIDLHLLGHIVGEILYKQQGVKGIEICTEDFRNACSHTIVVGLFLDKGEDALPDIARACHRAPGGKGAYTMCFHGLGHGILAFTEYDLPKAVEICKKTGNLNTNDRESIECIGGTIMEIIGGGGHDRELWEKQSKKYLNANNPLYPCSSEFMPDEARAQCYTYLTPHLFKLAGADLGSPTPEEFEEAFPFCSKIDNEANRRACYGGFGKEFVVLAKDRDIRKIEEMSDQELEKVYAWCMLAYDKKGINDCTLTAMHSIYWGGENNRDAAIRFCSLVSDNDLQRSCFEGLSSAVSFYIDENSYRKAFCEELPVSFRQSCQKRLGIPIL